MTKKEKRRLSPDGLPIDARDWTEADWQDLHEAIERVKRNVAARHKPKEESCSPKSSGKPKP